MKKGMRKSSRLKEIMGIFYVKSLLIEPIFSLSDFNLINIPYCCRLFFFLSLYNICTISNVNKTSA